MVEKIEQAMRELDELDLEQLAHFADVLARNAAWQNLHPIKPAAMKWTGCLKGGPYKNGLEAQEAAKHYRMFLLEREHAAVKYLLDANVWLESATEGANAREASDLIRGAAPGQLATTDFVLHAIGIIVTTRAPEQFREFLDDLINRRVFTLHLTPSDLYSVLDCMRDNDLDFDDAFQYVAAERYDLKIVSFDKHFDRTPRGRITPAQALSEIQQRPQP